MEAHFEIKALSCLNYNQYNRSIGNTFHTIVYLDTCSSDLRRYHAIHFTSIHNRSINKHLRFTVTKKQYVQILKKLTQDKNVIYTYNRILQVESKGSRWMFIRLYFTSTKEQAETGTYSFEIKCMSSCNVYVSLFD